MVVVLLLLRQVGIEPTTYCLEGSFVGLSIVIRDYYKRLKDIEIQAS